jgi:hypothetical protein
VLHFDNTDPHTANRTSDYLRANQLTLAPHLAFSPDLAPSDFYLFAKLKIGLMGAAFSRDDGLLQGVMEVLNGISREELEAAFEEWLRRLERSIQQNRRYVE